jgi:hypothetical protein
MAFTKLGSLSGRGRLLGREDYEFGPVEYRLDAFKTTHLKSGIGQLVAEPTQLLDALKAPKTFLELADGDCIEVVLTSTIARTAHFKTTGPVPGF